MAEPKPLTATPAPDIDWSREGTPAAKDFDDIYFSVEGGLAETETVFLKGCGLPERWKDIPLFTVGELGFGTGLNFLATWKLWQDTKPKAGRLHFISVEKFPFDREQLTKALTAWPELEDFATHLIEQWPGRVKGFHRLHFGDVTLTLIHDNVLAGLGGLSANIDAWFLDGFSPAKNPDMWSPDVMQELARLSAPQARLATFTVASAVRTALKDAGFSVEKKEGFGRKRHRLEAVYPGNGSVIKTAIKPIILGAGIAGASIAKAFIRRGIIPTIIDADDETMASGNAAAIIKPRIDLQDKPESRFYLSAYLYALSAYHNSEVILHTGIKHISKNSDEPSKLARFHDAGGLSGEHFTPTKDGAFYDSGLVIDPSKARAAWLVEAIRLKAHISRIEKSDQGWALYANDKAVAEGTHLIISAGFGVKSLGLGDRLNLRYSRGQLSWGEAIDGFDAPLTFGGYGIPLKDGLLVGTTHDRLDTSDPFEINWRDDMANLDGLSDKLGADVRPLGKKSRASIRVNTAQTWPVVGELEPQQYILSGLGSRGFVFAPLLGEDLVSRIFKEPNAISNTAWTRFQAREKPNPKARPSTDR